jgi:hypothetical protein
VPRRRSIRYPTNHLLAVLDDPAAGVDAAADLRRGGLADHDVSVLRGDGADAAIAGLGGRHSRLTALIRIVQYMTMDQMPDFAQYERALADRRTVVAVHVTDRPTLLAARDVLLRHGAHFLNYYGRVATEELGRWREPGANDWIERPFPDAEARKGRR